ncbi:hypothetical protein BH23ACT6_BH23ACT6_26130 [soil metagenome]
MRRLNTRYRYLDSPYEISLRHLLERVDGWCARWGVNCRVTADLIEWQADFTEATEGYTRVGTPGFRPSRLERIFGPQWVDSRKQTGVQAADMVAYILRRHREIAGSVRAQRATRSLAGSPVETDHPARAQMGALSKLEGPSRGPSADNAPAIRLVVYSDIQMPRSSDHRPMRLI